MALESSATGYSHYEKARIYIEGEGAQINSPSGSGSVEDSNGDKMSYFEFMFNPSEFKEGYTTKWSEGATQGQKSFLGFDRDTLSLDIVFDSYQTTEGPKDVRLNRSSSTDTYAMGNTAKADSKIFGVHHLKSLFNPVENKNDGNTKVPPTLVFVWGDFTYRGLLEKLNISYTMFLPNGIPVRAKVAIVLKAFMSDSEAEMSLGKTACRKVHTVMQGERLDSIAASKMKDPTLWKLIAKENGIIDMLNFSDSVQLGSSIIIPDLPKDKKNRA